MANGNGNRQWTIWVAGILATIMLTAVGSTIKSVIANDENSRCRDEKITIVFDAEVKSIRQEMTRELGTIKENQATLLARQNMVIDTLKEIKQDIKKNQ